MLEIILFVLTLAADQLVKLWAGGQLANLPGQAVPVIHNVFELAYVENRGASFGILQGHLWLFIPATLLSIAVVAYLLVTKRKKMSVWLRVALALLASGAAGNLIDRVFLGYVRDMFYFKLIDFAVFNVADACVSVAAVLLIVCVFFIDGRRKPEDSVFGGGSKAKNKDGGTFKKRAD